MEQELALKLKDSISVRVFMQHDGWKPMPAIIKNGEIELDFTKYIPTATYHLEINFAERFREIGSGSILVQGEKKDFCHQQGLDTKWETAFVGTELIEEICFTTRNGEDIVIPVKYIGIDEKKEAEEEKHEISVVVRVDYQLANVMWICEDAAQNIAVIVKAIEGNDEYKVDAVRLPTSKNFLAVDKLAAGKYSLQVLALDVNNKVVNKSKVIFFDIPRR